MAMTFNNIDLYQHADRFDTFSDAGLEGSVAVRAT